MATLPNTLLEPVPTHPVFEANQLLSFRDLNELRDYLDQQTRLTRVSLTGSGIVCGLVPHWDGTSVVISAGCGVSTEGFLISLDTCTLSHYQPVSLPRGLFLGKPTSATDVIEGFELFEEAAEKRTALSATSTADKIAVLLLECDDNKNESCLDDCDEKGTRRAFRIRKFLLHRAHALAIVEENFNPTLDNGRRRYPDWSLEDLLIGRYGLTDLYLERFGYTPAQAQTPARVKLTEIESYEMFLERYIDVIQAGAERVAKALSRTHTALSPLFSSMAPGSLPDLPADRFDASQLKAERRLEIQYLHDHLADLILAYHEFRDVAFDLMDVCRAGTGWFPKHLFLGAALAPGAALPIPPSTLRTPHVQPPVYNGNHWRVEAARLLFQRLRALGEAFQMPDPSLAPAVRITPSRWRDAPLGARAIPYYYRPEKNLHRVWNADCHRQGRDHRQYGYFPIDAPGNQPNPPYDDPLVFDFEGHDFYRIEGHVGLEKQVVFERLSELRACYNLAFDLVVLKLGELNHEDFHHDCEFQLLQVQYTKLRTDLLCALGEQDQTGPVKDLLAELVENLDQFDYASFEQRFVALLQSETQYQSCLLGYDRQAFSDLAELHLKRRKEVLEQTLFHKFAGRHPGMEHRAGVPRGGTFILVYHEQPMTDEDRQALLRRFKDLGLDLTRDLREEDLRGVPRQTVVADFCLPYLCCADCPPTAYMLARPRPTLLIDPMAFCANDDQPHDFVVMPPGGVILGRGTHRDGSRYYFVPADTGVEAGDVEVKYSVDGAEATLILQIKRVPQATFAALPPVICHNQQVPLRLLTGTPAGGSFTTDISDGNDRLGIIESDGQFFFDPTVEGVPRDIPIGIRYTVTTENGCTGSSVQTLQVRPAPNAGFSGLSPNYCDTAGPIELTPDDAKLKSVFDGEGVSGNRFDPRSVEFKDDLQTTVTITITHTVTDASGCQSSFSRQTRVFRQLQGRFTVDEVRLEAEKFLVSLQAIHPQQQQDGPLVFNFWWLDRNGERVLEERKNSTDFELSIPQARVQGMNFLTVGLVVPNGPCEGIPMEIQEIELPVDEPGGPGDIVVERETTRLAANRERLAALAAEHEGLDQTRTFRLADALVDPDRRRPAPELVEQFSDFVTTLTRGYSQLDSDERRKAYRALGEIAAHTMIDRVALETPDSAIQQVAAEHLRKLRDIELDLKALRADWLGGELSGVLDESRIDLVRRLFD